MLATKRYDYVTFDSIRIHPSIANHRPVNPEKVRHYAEDILKNGLLEPLIVWERNGGEYFLVGGFHRLSAIRAIREKNPGYFDRVDVRVVSGDVEEMRALNLKLNADRLDAKISDYFDTIIYLNNANWDKERIAAFLDKSVSWVEDIIRYVPGMDPRLRRLLEEGRLSWNRTRALCRTILAAAPGTELETADRVLLSLQQEETAPATPARRPITLRLAARKLHKQLQKGAEADHSYVVSASDLLSLLLVLGGKAAEDAHVERARAKFPALFE